MLTLTDISEKIESIRRQPEHMRIRYVWGCVAVSMVIVFILWIFSIASMFAGEKSNTNQTNAEITPSIGEQLQTVQEQASSLKDFNNQSSPINNEPTEMNDQDINSFPYSANDNIPADEPRSDIYSKLPNTNSSQ